MIAFWVVGAPVLVLVILIKNRKNLQQPFMKRYFLLLYQGLRKEAFYWEFINTLRKVMMPLSNVLLALFPAFYRAMLAIIILIALFRLQIKVNPYKLKENNEIEMLAIITGLTTLFGGIIFLDSADDEVAFIQLFALVVILFINIYFILRWVHLFMFVFKTTHPILTVPRQILGYALMQNKENIPMEKSTDANHKSEEERDRGTTPKKLYKQKKNRGMNRKKTTRFTKRAKEAKRAAKKQNFVGIDENEHEVYVLEELKGNTEGVDEEYKVAYNEIKRSKNKGTKSKSKMKAFRTIGTSSDDEPVTSQRKKLGKNHKPMDSFKIEKKKSKKNVNEESKVNLLKDEKWNKNAVLGLVAEARNEDSLNDTSRPLNLELDSSLVKLSNLKL